MSKFNMDSFIAQSCAAKGHRLDAGESAFFARQLEHVYAQTYDIQYPDNKARQVLPVDNSVDPGAEFVTYRQMDYMGEAKIIANYGKDFPRVDIKGAEMLSKIKSIGASYDYSFQDLRRARLTGTPIDALKAAAARRVIDNKIEDMAAFGDPNDQTYVPGFLNAPNVQLVSKGTYAQGTSWTTGATPAEIMANINKLTATAFDTTKGVWTLDTLLLPTSAFSYLASTPYVTNGFSNKNLLEWIKETNPWIKNIDHWNRLNAAGASGTSRIVAYAKNPSVVQLIIPQEFEQMPPELHKMTFEVSCHARCGGVQVRYPAAVLYMDAVV